MLVAEVLRCLNINVEYHIGMAGLEQNRRMRDNQDRDTVVTSPEAWKTKSELGPELFIWNGCIALRAGQQTDVSLRLTHVLCISAQCHVAPLTCKRCHFFALITQRSNKLGTSPSSSFAYSNNACPLSHLSQMSVVPIRTWKDLLLPNGHDDARHFSVPHR